MKAVSAVIVLVSLASLGCTTRVVYHDEPPPPPRREVLVETRPAPQPQPQTTVVVSEEQPIETIATEAPPAPREEVIDISVRPSVNHIWIHGHWAWNGHGWVWVDGHWHLRRPGYLWVEGHWAASGGRWHWVAGHWVAEAEMPCERPGEIDVQAAPPAPLHETIVYETRPAPNYVWVGGHWAWYGHWSWVHGHWHCPPAHQTWRAGTWVSTGGHWHWSAGVWVRF